MDSWITFNEIQLPPKCKFLNSLEQTHIKDEHAKTIRKHFKLKNMEQYHDLYHKIDTLLLSMYSKILNMYQWL